MIFKRIWSSNTVLLYGAHAGVIILKNQREIQIKLGWEMQTGGF